MENIPLILQSLFGEVPDYCSVSDETKENDTVVKLKPLTAGGTIVREDPDNEDIYSTTLIYKCREAVVRFLCLNEKCIVFPSSKKPTKKDIETHGQFWLSHQEHTQGLIYDFDIAWRTVLEDNASKVWILSQTKKLLQWIVRKLSSSDFTLSIKRQACSVIFEFLDLFFSVGHYLDLLFIDWDLTNPNESLDDISSNDIIESLRQPIIEPSEHQVNFFREIRNATSTIIHYGSCREAYVSLTSIFHKTHMGLPARLMILSFFPKVLNTFASKQASFLMSVNTTIHSKILTDPVFLKKAEESFQECRLNSFLLHQQPTDDISRIPFYLEWLVGSALYIVRYFELLGPSRLNKQTSDFYGVGPSSCSALLCKVITFLIFAFRVSYESKTNHNKCANGFVMELQWCPFDEIPSTETIVWKWIKVFQCKAEWCLYQLVSWTAESPKGFDGKFSFENTNTVTPLDDGSGELEMTPLNNALVACVSSFQHASSFYSRRPKALPMIMSSQRFVQIGFINAYVLLVAGRTDWKASNDLGLQNSIQACFMCETSFSHILSFRQKRTVYLGLGLFSWTCVMRHALHTAPNSLFETLFGLSVRPHSLLREVLRGLGNIEASQTLLLYKNLLSYCNQFIKRYSFLLQLQILTNLSDDYKTLSGSLHELGVYHVTILYLFKMVLSTHLIDSNPLTHPEICELHCLLGKLCRLSFHQETLCKLEQKHQDAIVLELLNALKLVLQSSALQQVAELLKEVSNQKGKSPWSIKACLNELVLRLDMEQQSQDSSKSCFCQLVPFVLRDVRLLLE